MNEHSQDDLNKFFKSKLNNQDLEMENWILPPDHVFDAAQSVVLAEYERKRNKRILIFILLLITISTAFYIFNLNSKLNHSNNRISQLEKTLANLEQKQNSGLIQNNNAIGSASFAVDEEDFISDNKRGLSSNQLNLSKHEQDTSSDKFFNAGQIAMQSTLMEDIRTPQKKIIIPSFEIMKTPEGGSQNAASTDEIVDQYILDNNRNSLPEPGKISRISIYPEFDHQRNLSSLPLCFAEPAEDNKVTTQGWTITANQNFIQSAFQMSIVESGTPNLTGYDKLCGSFGGGLLLQKGISKHLNLVVGGSYFVVNNQSELREQYLYDKSNEYDDVNNQSYYTANLSLNSPLGINNISTEFKVSSDDISDNDIIDNKTRFKHKLKISSLQIGLRYLFNGGQPTKMHLYAGGGLTYNHINSLSSSYSTELYMEDKMINQFENQGYEMKYLESGFYSGYAEFGMVFPVNNVIDLNSGLELNHSFNSLRKSNADGEPKTFLNQMKVSAGITIKL